MRDGVAAKALTTLMMRPQLRTLAAVQYSLNTPWHARVKYRIRAFVSLSLSLSSTYVLEPLTKDLGERAAPSPKRTFDVNHVNIAPSAAPHHYSIFLR
jgi:hypothetical protein